MDMTEQDRLFDSVIERIRQILEISTDSDVARALGLTPGAFAQKKHRGSIPYSDIISMCYEKSLSLDWILTGREPEAGPPSESKDEPGDAFNRADEAFMYIGKAEANYDYRMPTMLTKAIIESARDNHIDMNGVRKIVDTIAELDL